MKSFLIILSMTAFFSAGVFSDEKCSGTVKDVAISDDGTVRLRTAFEPDDHFTICDLDGTWNDIKSNTCNRWADLTQAAAATGKSIEIYYPNYTDCNNFASGDSAPKPNWILIYK